MHKKLFKILLFGFYLSKSLALGAMVPSFIFSPIPHSHQCQLSSKRPKGSLQDFCHDKLQTISGERENMILPEISVEAIKRSAESIQDPSSHDLLDRLTYDLSLDIIHVSVSMTAILKAHLLHNLWLVLSIEGRKRLISIKDPNIEALMTQDPFYMTNLDRASDPRWQGHTFVAHQFEQVLSFPTRETPASLKLYFPFLNTEILSDLLNRLPSNRFRATLYGLICASWSQLSTTAQLSSEEILGAPLDFPYALGLSEDEYSNLTRYTESDYREPNKFLRGKKTSHFQPSKQKESIDHWQSAILKSSLPLWKTSFRGDTPYPGMSEERYFEKYRPGEIIIEDNFVSTSYSFDVAEQWVEAPLGYLFVYVGISGTSISHLSSHPDENELVYPRATRWIVLKRDENLRVIYLKEIIPSTLSDIIPLELDLSSYQPFDPLDFSHETRKMVPQSSFAMGGSSLIPEDWKEPFFDSDHPFHIQSMQPDGHCLYNSLMYGLQSIVHLPAGEDYPDSSQTLRNRVAQFEQAHFLPTKEFGVTPRHIDGILNGAWGDEIEIEAFCKIYNVRVIVFKPTVPNRLAYCDNIAADRTIRIYFNGTNHYDAVVEQTFWEDRLILPSSFQLFKTDTGISLNKMERNYKNQLVHAFSFLLDHTEYDPEPVSPIGSKLVDLKEKTENTWFTDENSCGGPLHILKKIEHSETQDAEDIFPYSYAGVADSIREFSQANMISHEEKLKSISSLGGQQQIIASQYQELLAKINQFPPYLVNRMDLDTLINYFLKVGGIPNAVDSQAGVYSNTEEDHLYGAYQCAYTTVGPIHGYQKYGEILTVVKPTANSFWLSDLTGWHFMQEKLGSGKFTSDSLKIFDEKKALVEEISKHAYAPDHMHERLAMMLVQSLAQRKTTYGTKTQQTTFKQDSMQLLDSLLKAPNSCEFWRVASGSPELAYLEAKFYGGIAFQDMVAIVIPAETIVKIPPPILNALKAKTRVLTYPEAIAEGIICP